MIDIVSWLLLWQWVRSLSHLMLWQKWRSFNDTWVSALKTFDSFIFIILYLFLMHWIHIRIIFLVLGLWHEKWIPSHANLTLFQEISPLYFIISLMLDLVSLYRLLKSIVLKFPKISLWLLMRRLATKQVYFLGLTILRIEFIITAAAWFMGWVQ